MSNDVIVFVLPGKWECLPNEQWKFVMDNGRQGRAITMTENLAFDGLLKLVEDAFKIDQSKINTELSFWCPQASNHCTQTRLPPVTLGCDSELWQFRNMLGRNEGMNIFATFTEYVDGYGNCENLSTENDSVDGLDGTLSDNNDGSPSNDDTFFNESMLGLIESMEAAMLQKKGFGHGTDTGSTSRKRGRPSGEDVASSSKLSLHGRGQPFLTADDVGHTPPDGGEDYSCQSTALVPVDHRNLDGDEYEDMLPDPSPHLDNLIEYRPDERLHDLPINGGEIYIGKVFPTKGDLQTALGLQAIEAKYCYRLHKSDKSRVIAVCVDQSCKWRVYAKRHNDSDQFEIRTAHTEHTCCVDSRARFNKKATSKVIGHVLQSKYTNGKKGPRACEIPNIVLSELNVDISYMKAWYAKEAATEAARGKEEDSYKELSTYLHLLSESNPGTIYDLHTTTTRDNEIQFKYMFVALGSSVTGYQYLRKVVVIDGTQLKGKYKGCLVTASGQDGNMQIFPLAFGIVDSENIDSWGWFLDNLQTFVHDEKELVFVSDRHASITAALETVYPEAHHASCCVHLYRNVKARFKSSELAVLMTKAAKAYTVGEFRYYWSEIERRSPSCAMYLRTHGLKHWTLSHSPANRYNLMSSNISESLNAAVFKAVALPIVGIVEFMREMLMKWFATRRDRSLRWGCICTPEIEAILVAHHKEATACAVVPASEYVYQVTDAHGRVFTVDLEKKTCTCMVFNVLKIPCCHAIACTQGRGIDIYSLVSPAYTSAIWSNLYKEIVNPVLRAEDNPSPDSVPRVDVLPPKTKRPPGRPRTKRIPSRGEGLYRMGKYFDCGPRPEKKCGRCQGLGHNKSTCKHPI